MWNVFKLALATTFLFCGCQPQETAKVRYPGQIVSSIEYASTPQETKRQFVEDAKEVARVTGDAQATSLAQFVGDNGILAVPQEQGMQVLEAKEREEGFTLFIIPLSEVPQSSDLWRQYKDSSTVAVYNSDHHSMIIKTTEEVTPSWRGIILLHEADHAYLNLTGATPDRQNDQMYVQEEIEVHQFENRIITLLGGKAYEAVLENEIKRISVDYERNEKGWAVPGAIDLTDLNPIFGPPASELERKLRGSHVWMHALFRWADRKFDPATAQHNKEVFMHNLYKSKGSFGKEGQQ